MDRLGGINDTGGLLEMVQRPPGDVDALVTENREVIVTETGEPISV